MVEGKNLCVTCGLKDAKGNPCAKKAKGGVDFCSAYVKEAPKAAAAPAAPAPPAPPKKEGGNK